MNRVMNYVKLLFVMLLFSMILNCDVTFNSELREYVDNIVNRTPLDFSLAESLVLDGLDAINMGVTLSTEEVICTITNNEKTSIHLASFAGITDGDFTVSSFKAFTLEKSSSFTIAVTFNALASSFDSRVSQEITILDGDGRAYTFSLWATSRSQPLSLYDLDGEEVSIIDLGNWEDNRKTCLVVKNEGLEEISITDIIVPNASVLADLDFPVHMDINEEVPLFLGFLHDGYPQSGSNLMIKSDYPGDFSTGLALKVYAGGALQLDIAPNITDLGTYTSGNNPIVKKFTFTNNSLFSMDLSLTMSGATATFTTNLVSSIELEPGEEYLVQVSFYPEGGESGEQAISFDFFDENSGRTLSIQFSGTYSII